jgi:anionic cell wall polymer biosynthesis LytR-Cps2A-Psr (LCP) family protein
VKTLKLDKSAVFLILIALVLAAFTVAALMYLRTDAVEAALKNDQILKILFVLHDGQQPLFTGAFFFYPPTGRAALFDIPAETGRKIDSLDRVDRISALFKAKDPEPYRAEVADLLATDIPMYFTISLEQLGQLADLMDGLELFIPNPVELETPGGNVLFPQGARAFDGEKVRDYLTYEDPNELENDLVIRRQKAFLALLRRFAGNSAYLTSSQVLPSIHARMSGNLGRAAFRRLLSVMADLDVDRIVPSRVQGAVRQVDGQSLLFPHYNGDLLKDIVRQNLNALVNADGSGQGDRIFTLEVRNGTNVKGLAKKAADLYESFGYEILAVGNAERDDYQETMLIDRLGDGEVAQAVAQVIHCDNVQEGSREEGSETEGPDEGWADFILILGKDFSGRYVTR